MDKIRIWRVTGLKCPINVKVSGIGNYALIRKKNIFILRKYSLNYLKLNSHAICNLFSNISGKKVCLRVSVCRETECIVQMIKKMEH